MKYELTFFEAIEKCLNGEGFIQGDGFADGVYVKEKDGLLISVEGHRHHEEIGALHISRGLMKQKYKLFSVANKQAISK